MRTRLTVLDMDFGLSATLTGEGVPFPNADEKDRTIHNEYRVVVTRYIGGGDKVQRSFKYYDSQHNLEAGKRELGKANIELAFRSFIDDAILGTLTFETFCRDLGYNSDSRRALKIYNECRRSSSKASDLKISGSELIDVLNGLSAKGIE